MSTTTTKTGIKSTTGGTENIKEDEEINEQEIEKKWNGERNRWKSWRKSWK